MVTLRITELKNNIKPGDRFDIVFPKQTDNGKDNIDDVIQFPKYKEKQDDGLVGREIEKILRRKGHDIDSKTSGPDLKSLGIEVKTSRKGTKSRNTIGKMTASKIINNTWENTNIYAKTLCQLRIVWQRIDENRIEIVESKIYNFLHDEIQRKLREDFEYIQKQITPLLPEGPLAGPNKYLIAEKVTEYSYSWRIEHAAFQEMMQIADSKQNLKTKNKIVQYD